MSENHANFSGENNPFRKSLSDPEKRKALSKRQKEMWANLSPKRRIEITGIFSNAQANNEYHREHAWKNHKSGYHTSAKAGKVFYRSSWELSVAEYLDVCDLVESYKMEPYAVSWTDAQGATRKTRPDFLVTLTCNYLLMFEVKPKHLLDKFENNLKIIGQRNFCRENGIQHCVITRSEIENLGNILDMATRGDFYVY